MPCQYPAQAWLFFPELSPEINGNRGEAFLRKKGASHSSFVHRDLGPQELAG